MIEAVLDIVEKSMLQYLEDVLFRNAPEKHEQIRAMFGVHMRHIAEYCVDNYMNKSELTIPFIKGLHKILFPKGYTQTTKMVDGTVVVSMIPGQYKTLDNTGVSYLYSGKEATLVPPMEVKESMEWLVSDFNLSIAREEVGGQTKKDSILFFMLDFFHIHPFGDANGRVVYILVNLLFLKQNLPSIRFDILKKKNLPAYFRAIELSLLERNLASLYEVINQYGNQN